MRGKHSWFERHPRVWLEDSRAGKKKKQQRWNDLNGGLRTGTDGCVVDGWRDVCAHLSGAKTQTGGVNYPIIELDVWSISAGMNEKQTQTEREWKRSDSQGANGQHRVFVHEWRFCQRDVKQKFVSSGIHYEGCYPGDTEKCETKSDRRQREEGA